MSKLLDALKQRLPADENYTLVDEQTLQIIYQRFRHIVDPVVRAIVSYSYEERQPLAVSEICTPDDDDWEGRKFLFHELFCAEPVLMKETGVWNKKYNTRISIYRESTMLEFLSTTWNWREYGPWRGDQRIYNKCKIKWEQFCVRKCKCGTWYGTYINRTDTNIHNKCCHICANAKYRARKEHKRLAQQPYNAARSQQAAEKRAGKACAVCGKALEAQSAKKAYCSSACRQKAFRRSQANKLHELQENYDRVMAMLNSQDQSDTQES